MRKTFIPLGLLILASACSQPQSSRRQSTALPDTVHMTQAVLKDKIMGGWAGQTIGVTFGGPFEFRFNGTFVADYQPLVWHDGYLKDNMINNPGLYDDIYMDLTFVDVLHRVGLDAPVDSFAEAFAHAGYMLWHANQAARYNILNDIKAPESGFWKNNPHADDIDYQIESDFSGLMSPGMPNAASSVSDKIGHIMNYGDGWYGGVFMGAMYTMAFISSDIPWIIDKALQTIPSKSLFYQCIADVIQWHQQYPKDWHRTWFEIQKKWASDIGCPDGVFNAFNIDAKVNAAYVVMALLYGNKDFTKTLEIATRAGQDADCNPSSAGGILGTIVGYSHIPEYWKRGLNDIEDINFKYTTMSLHKVYQISYEQAKEMISKHGGSVSENGVIIKVQEPKPVRYEKSFPDMYPQIKKSFYHSDVQNLDFNFTGNGFVLMGGARKKAKDAPDYVFNIEVSIDGQKAEVAKIPTAFTVRRQELCWRYALPQGEHKVHIKVLNPNDRYEITSSSYIVYSDQPVTQSTRN